MKVLKTAAIIVGAVALVATGVGLAVGAGLAAGIGTLTAAVAATGIGTTIASSLVLGSLLITGLSVVEALTPKPSMGGSQTKWKADPYAGLPYVMGRTLVAGNIVYRRGSGGSNTYEQFVTVLGIGPLQSIDATFMNKTTVTFNGAGAANGTYGGYIWQRQQLGACPEASALTPGAGTAPGWTAAHKLSGLAATMLTFKYDAKAKNGLTSEPTPGWIVHGCKVWDPRADSTYPGGVGSCRAADALTHVWSENPHLHALKWTLGSFHNGTRVAGIGAPIGRIDVAAFVEGANLDDARGWKIGGQVTTRPDTPWNNLKLMLQAGGATPVLMGGLISCVNRAPRVSLATITRGDIVGDCSFAGTQPRRTRINGVIPSYRSEVHDWQIVSAAGVSVPSYVALDGDERTKEIQYSLVQDVNQVAQLATYDIADAREAGPGSIPLKPWWLNYRVGDCVTFSPEDAWSVKVLITGRAIEAQSGVVTYDVRSETDAKHAFALGRTGTAPPTASIVYDTGVPAPAAGDWTLTGTALTDNGTSIPALHLTGATGNASADAIIFEHRLAGTGGWVAAGTEPAATVDKVMTGVTPGTGYEVAVSYRVRGVVGDRLVLGPVTAGSAATPGSAQSAIATSYPTTAPLMVAADGTITIADHLRRYTDGHADVAVTGATIASGLAAGAFRAIGYDDLGRVGGAVGYQLFANDIDARASPTNPGRHYVGYVTIPAAGAPPASGGGASPPGGYCPHEDEPILLADTARGGPGGYLRAGDIRAGDWVWTRHELTLAWGAYAVEAVETVDADVWVARIDGALRRATAAHLYHLGTWTRMDAIGVFERRGRVVRMTVQGAHTMMTGDVLSHNIKQTSAA